MEERARCIAEGRKYKRSSSSSTGSKRSGLKSEIFFQEINQESILPILDVGGSVIICGEGEVEITAVVEN